MSLMRPPEQFLICILGTANLDVIAGDQGVSNLMTQIPPGRNLGSMFLLEILISSKVSSEYAVKETEETLESLGLSSVV